MVDLYFPIYAMKTMMENNHETRYGGGAMNLREIPEGYMMQQVGVTALRNGDGSFRPAVPIHMLVPTAAAIEAEERQAADAAGDAGRDEEVIGMSRCHDGAGTFFI